MLLILTTKLPLCLMSTMFVLKYVYMFVVSCNLEPNFHVCRIVIFRLLRLNIKARQWQTLYTRILERKPFIDTSYRIGHRLELKYFHFGQFFLLCKGFHSEHEVLFLCHISLIELKLEYRHVLQSTTKLMTA